MNLYNDLLVVDGDDYIWPTSEDVFVIQETVNSNFPYKKIPPPQIYSI